QARSNLNSKIEGDLKKDAARAAERAADRKIATTPDPTEKTSDLADTKEGALSREVKVTGGSRSPSARGRVFDVEERVKAPESLKNSRYIKYNLNDLYKDIEDSTR